jgi:hypothetical protein
MKIPDPARKISLGKNDKTYEEAFASFRDKVLDVLDMKRTDEKFKREVLSKTVLWHAKGFFGVRYRTLGAGKGKARREASTGPRQHAQIPG